MWTGFISHGDRPLGSQLSIVVELDATSLDRDLAS
jgi:hypothetical protein